MLKKTLASEIKMLLTAGLFYLQAFTTMAQTTCVTGSYLGTGGALTISGIGFQPDAVIIKAVTNTGGMFIKTSTMGATSSRAFRSNAALVTDAINGFNSDGFTLSTNAGVNTSGTTYYYTAFLASASVRVGTYTGNGAASQNITLTPAAQAGLTLVIPAAATGGYLYYTSNGTAFGWFVDNGGSNSSSSGSPGAPANGFNAFTAANSNTNTAVYHYISFVNTSGICQVAGYTGNGSDGRNIVLSGTTFQPGFMMITKSGTNLVMRNSKYEATDATQYYGPTADAANLIQLFNTDGFQLGTDAAVNTNTTSYVYVAFGGPAVTELPIELLNFDVHCTSDNKGVDIHWATATEINNDYFTIERSFDAVSFQAIATIKGAGNSLSIKNYNYADMTFDYGKTVYYRLRQTDYDGKTETFKIVNASCQEKISPVFYLRIVQNPVQNGILLYDLNTGKDGLIQLEIIDIMGRVVKNESFYTQQGLNRYGLQVNDLSDGMYYLRLTDGQNLQSIKFIK